MVVTKYISEADDGTITLRDGTAQLEETLQKSELV